MTATRIASQVLLIGWGGADWKVIQPLLEAGELPELASVIEQGVHGNLRALSPTVTPMLLAAAVTGKRPQKHGILGYIEPGPRSAQGIQPVTSTSRKTKALWNILTHSGLRSHVIGWSTTHPAEPIHGVMVSDLFACPSGPNVTPWPLPRGTIHPSRLGPTLAELRVHPAELGRDHILPFVPRAGAVGAGGRRRLEEISASVAANSAMHAAATWLLEHEPWDFAAVYYDGIARLSRRFMEFHGPRMEHVSEEDFELYRGVVGAAYRFQDMMLGRLLALAGTSATVVIVSDHGFHSDHLRPDPRRERESDGLASWNRPYGIVCMKGPGIKRNERIYGASLLDLAPTVLTLFGLAVANDMDGRPLLQAFNRPVGLRSIRTWEHRGGDFGTRVDATSSETPWEAQELLEQLRRLGHIEPPGEDRQSNLERADRERRRNLARAYLDSEMPEDAARLFEELLAAGPEQIDCAFHLAQALHQMRAFERCRQVVDRFFPAEGGHPGGELLRGTLLTAEGRAEEALDHLFSAQAALPGLPGVQQHIGMAYLALERWGEAERAFRNALDLDGDSAGAHYGLAVTYLRQKRLDEAIEEALSAVGLRHFFPEAHFYLGVALARAGQQERAVQAFETCLAMRPQTPEAHRWLGVIHERAYGDREKAAAHRRQVEALLRRSATRTRERPAV